MKTSKQKKSLNKYLQLTGIAFQMGATIYLAVYIGKKLDLKFPNEKNWFTLGMTFLGLIIALAAVVIQSKKINH